MKLITVTIEVNSPVVGETLTVSLFRLDGYGIVVSKTVTLSTATVYTATFDLTIDPFVPVTAGVAIGGGAIYMAKQGDYVIQVADVDGNITSSAMFAISIVPVWEMKNEWMKGVALLDYEVLEPRVQPQNTTGVTVIEVSADHLKGPFSLVYTAGTPFSLAWGGGQAVNGYGSGLIELLLMNTTGDFIMVQVNTFLLPNANTSDTLYIDNGRMKNRAFIDQVRRATAWVEQEIVVKVEPSIVDTDPQLPGHGYADEVAIPETYYRPRTYNKWMSFKIPYPQILDMSVFGFFNMSQAATVPREWLVWDQVTGICELVPSTSAQVVWSLYNSLFVMAYLFDYASIPSFWHYTATVGLRDLRDNKAIVREAIAKKAAIEILNTAGSSYRAGFASQSASRDGVSQSQGFTSSAMYGTYGAHFTQYQTWLDKQIPRMRTRFGGIQYVTI
jgi:hypothetical protein